MRSYLSAVTILCLWTAALAAEEAPKDDGAEALVTLGKKAEKIESLHLTLVLILDAIDMHEAPEDDEPKAVERHESSVVELWYRKKDGLFRSDDIRKGQVRGLLVSDLGAIMWLIRDRKFVAKAMRFPRERFLLRDGEFNPTAGVAGFFLDGLHGYAGLLKAFVVTRKGEEDGITRFTLTPRPGGPFPKGEVPVFELGVDVATGLAVEFKMQTAENDGERATSSATVVRVEIDPVIRDAFLLPQDVCAAGIQDAATGKPVEVPKDE